METWNNVKDEVQKAFDGDDAKSRSTLKHLNSIIKTAKDWEIDPAKAQSAAKSKPSNLREIIKEARKAIRKENKGRLDKLFTLAAEMNNKDLRLTIRELDLEEIIYKKVPGKFPSHFYIEIDQDQLNRISENTKLHYKFIELE